MTWWQVASVLFLTPFVKELLWPDPKCEYFNFCVALLCWVSALLLTLVKLMP